MRSRLAALPLLASCGLDAGLSRTVYVEVPVADTGLFDESGLSEGSGEADWDDNPGYPGEHEDDEDVTEIIPGGEEPDDAEVTRVSDDLCEELLLTSMNVGEAIGIYAEEDSMHYFAEGEGLYLYLRSEFQKDPNWDAFACVKHFSRLPDGEGGAAYFLMGEYGSYTSYNEADPVTGEWYADPLFEVKLDYYESLPLDIDLLELAVGYVDNDTSEIFWFYHSRPSLPFNFFVFPEGNDPQVVCGWC